jgi:DNA-directed RNA polymerase specialized sigma24 family protein
MSKEDDARRRAILADPEVHKAIRKVARLRGVSADQVDDILGEVVKAALEDEKMPVHDPDEACLYLCGMARFKAIDIARENKRDRDHREGEQAVAESETADDAEDEVHARKIIAWAEKTFGRPFEWFVRHTVHRETHRAIAADANVSPDHVRKTVASIRVSMSARMATLGVAVLLAAILGLHYWRTPGGQSSGPGRDLADTVHTAEPVPPVRWTGPPKPPTPAEAARALRDRANRELGNGQWDECVADIAQAQALDPAGHTPAVQSLYEQCDKKLRSLNAKPR